MARHAQQMCSRGGTLFINLQIVTTSCFSPEFLMHNPGVYKPTLFLLIYAVCIRLRGVNNCLYIFNTWSHTVWTKEKVHLGNYSIFFLK